MKKIKIFLSIFSLFIFAGCNNEKDTSNKNTLTVLNELEESQNEKEKLDEIPQRGGELNISMRMPKTLNPLINEDCTVDSILKLVFEPLFNISNDNLKPIPNLVSSYEMYDDGKTVIINMKDNIYWHDGNPITSKDVIFSLDVIRNASNSLYKGALDKVYSYSNKDNQVIINYIEPYSFFLYNLCFPIIPSHYYKGNLNLDSKESFIPIGSGVFKFHDYRIASELILKKTLTFKGEPYIDSIRVLILPDRQTDIYSFEKNITNSILTNFSEWGNINPIRDKISVGILSNNFEFLGFNFEKDIFKNLELRKAIAYVIPKDEIIQNIYLDNGIESLTPINPYSYLGASHVIENYNYDLEKAISYISKANISMETANFTILVNKENKERIETAEIIAKRLKQIGINIDIVKKSFEEYKVDLEEDNFDIFLGGIDFGLKPNFESFLMSSGTGSGGINYQNFQDYKMDYLIKNMYNAIGEENLINQSIEVQKYFSEQLPVIGILFKDQILLNDYTIKGEKIPSIYSEFNNIQKWYIKEEVKND